MDLYFAKSTISVAVAIALEEASLPYTPRALDFASGEQTKPEYLAVNPKGRVPALVTDAGLLTETGAILEHIAGIAPDAGLLPADPMQAAHARMVMFYLASTMHVAHAHGKRGARWADRPESWADMVAKLPQTMTACAAYVEAECLRGTYVLGDTLSLADPYLFMVCSWLEGDGVPTAPYPKITAFLAAMEGRASVKAVRAKGLM